MNRAITYHLFDRSILVRADDPRILAYLRRRESSWTPFLVDPSPRRPDVVIEVLRRPGPSPIRRPQAFSNERFVMHGSRIRLLTGYAYARPWQFHVQSYVDDVEATIDTMLLPVLNTVMLRLGLVNLHAAGVTSLGRALVLVGGNGAGKSTTALHLARAGCGFLSDNDVYLRRSGRDDIEVLAGDPRLHLRPAAMRVFPELRAARRSPLAHRGGVAKRRLDMRTGAVGPWVTRARLGALAFLRVSGGRHTSIRQVPASQALARLMRAVPARGLPAQVKDRVALGRMFDLLAEVASRAPVYAVSAGRDARDLTTRLKALLE